MITRLIRRCSCQNDLGYAIVVKNPRSPPNRPQILWIKPTKVYFSCTLQAHVIKDLD